jgi:mannosyltransferase
MMWTPHAAAANRARVLLVLVLLLGAVLRLHGLERQSLWNDELTSWHQSSLGSLSEVVRLGVAPDVHPPGYQTVLYFSQRTLGDSEWALRMPSAIAGILAIYVIFRLGELLFSRREGLLAAGIAAVAWCPIYYSQEARAYSLLLLASAAATWFWLEVLKALDEERAPAARFRVGYAAAAVACAYLHYFGLFIVALQAAASAAFALHRPKAAPTLLVLFGVVGASYLPWLSEFWNDLHHGTSWIPQPTPAAALDCLAFFFNRSTALALFVCALYAVLSIRWVADIARRGEASSPAWRAEFAELFLFGWLVLPFAVVYVKSIVSAPALTDRNLIVSLPAAYLLLARAITRLPLRPRLQDAVGACVVLCIAIHTTVALQYYSRPTKQQFREAVRFVVDRESQFEDAIVVGNVYGPEMLDYYFEHLGSDLRVRTLGGSVESFEHVIRIVEEEEPMHVWYIAAHLESDPRFLEALGDSMEFVGAKRFIMADVLLYRTR